MGAYLTLVKVNVDISCQHLIILVTLACQNDNIALSCDPYRMEDSFLSVGDAVAGNFRTLKPCHYLINNSVGVFISGVIRCYYEIVCKLSRSLCHKGALCAVTVAAAAEDCNHTACAEATHSFQNIFQRIGGVGIVADDEEILSCGDYLAPSPYALEAAHGFGYLFHGDFKLSAHGNGRSGVQYIVAAHHSESEREALSGAAEPELCHAARILDIACVNACIAL